MIKNLALLLFIAVLLCGRTPSAMAADNEVPAAPWPMPPKGAFQACTDLAADEENGARSSTVKRAEAKDQIAWQDWSDRDLSGQSFAGKTFFKVSLRRARLVGADFTGALICDSELSDADLTGARLDRALIGGATKLDDANFSNASARGIVIEDAIGPIRIDGADMRGASTFCNEMPACLEKSVSFASIVGADLRGAAIGSFCCDTPGLGTARLDGVATPLGYGSGDRSVFDLAQFGAGVGAHGRATFVPGTARSNRRSVTFTGHELQQLPALIALMSKQGRPGFDCTRARTVAERTVCSSPELAALDNGLNWLWRRSERSATEQRAQAEWLVQRNVCAEAPGKAYELKRCIEQTYVARIKALAPKAPPMAVGNGRYTSDAPLRLPDGDAAVLMRKYLLARGYREDEVAVENLGTGNGRIAGYASGANGHLCSLAQPEAGMKRTGAVYRVEDGDVTDLIVMPDVVIVGNTRFLCGARAGWSEIYYRQPDDLIGELKRPLDMNEPG